MTSSEAQEHYREWELHFISTLLYSIDGNNEFVTSTHWEHQFHTRVLLVPFLKAFPSVCRTVATRSCWTDFRWVDSSCYTSSILPHWSFRPGISATRYNFFTSQRWFGYPLQWTSVWNVETNISKISGVLEQFNRTQNSHKWTSRWEESIEKASEHEEAERSTKTKKILYLLYLGSIFLYTIYCIETSIT